MELLDNKSVLIFDDYCVICNGFVNFLIKRDRKDRFRFTSTGSPYGKKIMEKFQLDSDQIDSVILLQNNQVHVFSTATLKALASLGGIWKGASILRLIPRFLRDPVYRFFAARRYKTFGKYDKCPIPAPEWRHKFI